MSPRNCRRFIFILATLITFNGMIAAQSTEFTYQGRLLFGDVPANGSYDFEFALFDADSGGNQLGPTFPLSAVNVNNGVFSVRVDFGDQFPGSSRFLEIHVKQSGSGSYAVLSPRQAISSAPYSIKSLNATNADSAANANQLGGVSAGQYVVTSDTRLSDARTPLPGNPSYIQNGNSQQPLSSFNISGTGAANIFNVATQYNIGGHAVLSMPGTQNLFGGQGSGQANTTGTFNTFFGTAAGNVNTTGISNSLFGNLAGVSNTTGSFNSFFGDGAGNANTTANSNSFFGGASGAKTTTGGSNSFFGTGSGASNTTGTANAFFGGNGIANTTGFSNTFIGVGAGNGNSTGADNSFFGAGAGTNNTTGINNTAIGIFANVATGNLSFATAIGAFSTVSTSNTVVLGRPVDGVVVPGTLTVNGTLNAILPVGSANYVQNSATTQQATSFNISGSGTADILTATTQFNLNGSRVLHGFGAGNIFVGRNAGNVNSTGINNAFVGEAAGLSNTTGSANSFFGNTSGARNTTGNSNSIFGSNAGQFSTGSSNAFFGFTAGFGTTSGNSNTFIGTAAGLSNTVENNNTLVGASADSAAGATNATAVGFRAQVTQSNSLVLGSINGLNGATADTRVGIGTSAPARHLHIFGASDQEIAIQSSDAGGRMWTLQSSRGTANGNFQIVDRTSNLSRLAIDLNGNVGISDSSPAAKLDIAVNSGQILVGDAGCNAGFTGIGFAATLAGCSNFSLLGNGTDTIINRPTGGVLVFRENNSTQMSIASGGIVSLSTLGSGGTGTLCRNASGQISTCSAIQGESGDTFVKATSGSVHLRTIGGDFAVSPSGSVTVSGLLSIGLVPGGGSLNLCLSGTTVSLCSSSIRYKTNLNAFHYGLDIVKRLRPVTFNWKSDNTPDMGLVAEDVAKVEPLLVTHNNKGEVEGVKYDRVGVVLVNAVNEQQSEIESLRTTVDTQKEALKQQQEKLDKQQAEIAGLKKLVCARRSSAAVCRR